MTESIWGIRERLETKMKPELRIEDDGRRDKGAGEGKTKLGKEEDLEDLSKYISSNLEGFSFNSNFNKMFDYEMFVVLMLFLCLLLF